MAGSILILDTRDISYELESILSSEGFTVFHPEDISLDAVRSSRADIVITDMKVSLCAGTPLDHIIHSIHPHVYIVFLDPGSPISPPLSPAAAILAGVPFPLPVKQVCKAVRFLFGDRKRKEKTITPVLMQFNREFPNVNSGPDFKCYFN